MPHTAPDLRTQFMAIVEHKYPMMLGGIKEAHAVDPELVDRYFNLTLRWMVDAFGVSALERIADGYAFFTMEVNREQVRYEKTGRYQATSFAECNDRIYQNHAYMTHYYWGVYAILFCWPHYVEMVRFYLDRFVGGCKAGSLLEVAPGHGTWGLLAAHHSPHIRLDGLDISPTFLDFAPVLARAAGLADRCSYACGDATATGLQGRYGLAVCSFMLEHLEEPGRFLASLRAVLTEGGRCFVTLALTAAQPDHIYEFVHPDEAVAMAQQAGLSVVDQCVFQPRRTLPGARFVPRIQGLILERG